MFDRFLILSPNDRKYFHRQIRSQRIYIHELANSSVDVVFAGIILTILLTLECLNTGFPQMPEVFEGFISFNF